MRPEPVSQIPLGPGGGFFHVFSLTHTKTRRTESWVDPSAPRNRRRPCHHFPIPRKRKKNDASKLSNADAGAAQAPSLHRRVVFWSFPITRRAENPCWENKNDRHHAPRRHSTLSPSQGTARRMGKSLAVLVLERNRPQPRQGRRRRALAGTLKNPTVGATHYHAQGGVAPLAWDKTPSADIGNHRFYNNVE